MERKCYPVGAVIFRQGDNSQDVYRIVSGSVQVMIKQSNGEDLLLATLGEGDIFGEMAMVDESPRSATVIVSEAADMEVMEPTDFSETFFENPVVMAPYLACLIDRLRSSNEKLFDLTQKLEAGGENEPAVPKPSLSISLGTGLVLLPKSPLSKRTLQLPRIFMKKFPFRIGRQASGKGPHILQKNDLSLINCDPVQVAMSHISIEQEDGSFYVRDRKTRRGTSVNGKRLHQDEGELLYKLSDKDNELTVGDESSPLVYELRML
jgi:hypothetical protein